MAQAINNSNEAIHPLKAKIASTLESLSYLAAQNQLGELLNPLKAEIEELASLIENLPEKFAAITENTEQYVKDHLGSSLCVAGVVGLLAGYLVNRK
jgi:ElaB/YqjD/DUF883 family membrane-anchored ribosome-binding protein